MKINSSKVWNILFNALISVTLILCIFMMAKYFYFKDLKPLNYGNVSDMIIAFSNFIMATTAIFAAYKAYKWFDETKHVNASNAVVKVIQDCMNINSILNAIRSNIENQDHTRLSNKPLKLITAYSEFKKSKFALKSWGSYRFDKNFINNIEKIRSETYAIYRQINGNTKRQNVITQKSLIEDIKKTSRMIRNLEKKEIDDILLKKN